jgi:hypothetical protein
MSSQQLSADGLQTQGTPRSNTSDEPGCDFKGKDVVVTIYKNQTQTVSSYQQQGHWDTYTKTTVNGRPAAHAQGSGTSGTGGCTILMDAGGGVVLVDITDPDKSDEQACAEDMKYAQQVEPTLPK